MTTDPLDELDHVFDDHPSLSASLEDFEEPASHRSPLFGLPSQHSGLRSAGDQDDGSEPDIDSTAGEPWSPPGFRRRLPPSLQPPTTGSAWYRQQPYLVRDRLDLRPQAESSPSRSREPSPQYEDALEDPMERDELEMDLDDLTFPANIPLPPGSDSPLKGRSPSPEVCLRRDGSGGAKGRSGDDDFEHSPSEHPLTNCELITNPDIPLFLNYGC